MRFWDFGPGYVRSLEEKIKTAIQVRGQKNVGIGFEGKTITGRDISGNMDIGT